MTNRNIKNLFCTLAGSVLLVQLIFQLSPAKDENFESVSANYDLQRATEDYSTYCSACHGENGAGDGQLAKILDPKPTPHNNPEYINSLSDDYLFTLLRDGGPAVGKSELMAPWKDTLSEQQIRGLIIYIRQLTN